MSRNAKLASLRLLVAGAALGAIALTGHGAPNTDWTSTKRDGDGISFEQEDFPCQEDEVLGYHPSFGVDQVGCIHIDVLLGEA